MKYNVLIKYKDGKTAYLSHKGNSSWTHKTAKKHMRDVCHELINDSPKWANVDYFACVMA